MKNPTTFCSIKMPKAFPLPQNSVYIKTQLYIYNISTRDLSYLPLLWLENGDQKLKFLDVSIVLCKPPAPLSRTISAHLKQTWQYMPA